MNEGKKKQSRRLGDSNDDSVEQASSYNRHESFSIDQTQQFNSNGPLVSNQNHENEGIGNDQIEGSLQQRESQSVTEDQTKDDSQVKDLSNPNQRSRNLGFRDVDKSDLSDSLTASNLRSAVSRKYY